MKIGQFCGYTIGAIVIMIPIMLSGCTNSLSEDDEPSNVITVTVSQISDIKESDILNISGLTITGRIQGNDWNVLSEMALYGNLCKLNMADATIVGENDRNTTHLERA